MARAIRSDKRKKPGWAVQYEDAEKVTRTIRLGRCGHEAARTFADNLTKLLNRRRLGLQVDADDLLSAWLAGLSDDLHGRLAVRGFIEARTPDAVSTAPTLAEWINRYEASRTDLKPGSLR